MQLVSLWFAHRIAGTAVPPLPWDPYYIVDILKVHNGDSKPAAIAPGAKNNKIIGPGDRADKLLMAFPRRVQNCTPVRGILLHPGGPGSRMCDEDAVRVLNWGSDGAGAGVWAWGRF